MKYKILALALTLGSASLAYAADGAGTSTSAVTRAAALRTPEDMARDVNRKPLAMLDFARVAKGQTIVDFFPGGGYFTRLFAERLGGTGALSMLVPEAITTKYPQMLPRFQTLAKQMNISLVMLRDKNFATENSVDMLWTAQNYHDLHNVSPQSAEAFNRAVFTALKHGGYYVIEDHAAEAGSGARDTNTLHRIDAALVRQEAEAAGFVMDGESDALRNPEDTHTLNVFNPAIRGKTDQFVYRFRKP